MAKCKSSDIVFRKPRTRAVIRRHVDTETHLIYCRHRELGCQHRFHYVDPARSPAARPASTSTSPSEGSDSSLKNDQLVAHQPSTLVNNEGESLQSGPGDSQQSTPQAETEEDEAGRTIAPPNNSAILGVSDDGLTLYLTTRWRATQAAYAHETHDCQFSSQSNETAATDNVLDYTCHTPPISDFSSPPTKVRKLNAAYQQLQPSGNTFESVSAALTRSICQPPPTTKISLSSVVQIIHRLFEQPDLSAVANPHDQDDYNLKRESDMLTLNRELPEILDARSWGHILACLLPKLADYAVPRDLVVAETPNDHLKENLPTTDAGMSSVLGSYYG